MMQPDPIWRKQPRSQLRNRDPPPTQRLAKILPGIVSIWEPRAAKDTLMRAEAPPTAKRAGDVLLLSSGMPALASGAGVPPRKSGLWPFARCRADTGPLPPPQTAFAPPPLPEHFGGSGVAPAPTGFAGLPPQKAAPLALPPVGRWLGALCRKGAAAAMPETDFGMRGAPLPPARWDFGGSGVAPAPTGFGFPAGLSAGLPPTKAAANTQPLLGFAATGTVLLVIARLPVLLSLAAPLALMVTLAFAALLAYRAAQGAASFRPASARLLGGGSGLPPPKTVAGWDDTVAAAAPLTSQPPGAQPGVRPPAPLPTDTSGSTPPKAGQPSGGQSSWSPMRRLRFEGGWSFRRSPLRWPEGGLGFPRSPMRWPAWASSSPELRAKIASLGAPWVVGTPSRFHFVLLTLAILAAILVADVLRLSVGQPGSQTAIGGALQALSGSWRLGSGSGGALLDCSLGENSVTCQARSGVDLSQALKVWKSSFGAAEGGDGEQGAAGTGLVQTNTNDVAVLNNSQKTNNNQIQLAKS